MIFQTLDIYDFSLNPSSTGTFRATDSDEAHTIDGVRYDRQDNVQLQYDGSFISESDLVKPGGQIVLLNVDKRLRRRFLQQKPGTKRMRIRLVRKK